MTAGLDAPRFAKVRALHDRTDIPGEKAAAGRMEALARAAGMTAAEAVSKFNRPKPMPKATPKSHRGCEQQNCLCEWPFRASTATLRLR